MVEEEAFPRPVMTWLVLDAVDSCTNRYGLEVLK